MDMLPTWKQVAECRELLDGADAIGYRDLFDEFIQHHEFGLALEVVCDYLIEAPRKVDVALIAQTQFLLQAIEVEDDCAVRLEAAMIGSKTEA